MNSVDNAVFVCIVTSYCTGQCIVPLQVDSVDKVEFTVELDNFEKSEVCQVMKDRVGVVQAVKITDTKGCRLVLTVTSELCGGAIKVCLFLCLSV